VSFASECTKVAVHGCIFAALSTTDISWFSVESGVLRVSEQ